MRIRLALALFLLLGICSVASMKPIAGAQSAFDGGGGLPTPCLPKALCSQHG